MIDIEGIKFRTDIKLLREKYGIGINAIGKEIGVNESTIRHFLLRENATLSLKTYKKLKEGLIKIQNALKEAKEYKGFE